jgi:hypothetical protein
MLENGDSSPRRWSRDRFEARTRRNRENAIAPADVRKAMARSMLLALVFSLCLAAMLAAHRGPSVRTAAGIKPANLLASDERRSVTATALSR